MRRGWMRAIGLLCVLLSFALVSTASASTRVYPVLTTDELHLVEASKTTPVTVGLIPGSPPACYWDATENRFDGVFVRMLETIGERTGLQIELVDIGNNIPVQWLKAGKTDLVAGILKTQNFLLDKELVLSQQLLGDAIVVVGRKGDNFTERASERTIAIPTGFQVAMEYAAKQFPEHRVLNLIGIEQCLDAVADGRADAMMYMQTSMQYILQKPYYENLEIIQTFTWDADTCVAARAADGGVLLRVINKGLSMIEADERNNMILRYTIKNPYRLTVSDMFYKYRIPMIVISALVLAVIGVLSALGAYKRKSARSLWAAYEQEKAALAIAERASAAKGNFMSRMSHEIRTPLNAVIGYNTIARNELANARDDDALRQASARVMDCLVKSDIASKHLLVILNDVLDMSAIESGNIQVANERFDLKNMIAALTVLFFAQANARHIHFTVTLDAPVEEWLIGDPMRVRQILTNLLSNALKFTPEGGTVRLAIHEAPPDARTAHFRFTVSDTGIGMEKAYLEHIWTPFEQADSTISRRFGGTGLGLAITKNLVDLMRGTIAVESAPGAGSTFTVDLPFARTEQAQAPIAHSFSDGNALVIDSDPAACVYLRALLEQFGMRAIAVAPGRNAFNAIAAANARQMPFTVCLIEWRAPEPDNAQVVQLLRQAPGGIEPLLIATAYDVSAIEIDARHAGIDRFATKPVFQSTLAELLASANNAPAATKRASKSSFHFTNTRVLLVEDNSMNMEIARRLLASAGMQVDGAWNGREAVDMFVSSPVGRYQAILMDIQMPEMNGYEATRRIRESAHAQAASIPIFAMTADAFAENVAAALDSGMNGHIAKPIHVETLFKTLQNAIYGAQPPAR